jgi:hypothetical protein
MRPKPEGFPAAVIQLSLAAALCVSFTGAPRAAHASEPLSSPEGEPSAVENVFEVRAGEKTSRLVIRENTQGGERTYTSKTGELEQFYRYDSLNRLMEWRFSNPGKNTVFTAIRERERVDIRGTVEGKPVEKRLEIGEEPWFQNSEFGLLPFARSPEKTTEFFVIDPDGLKKAVLKARKVSGEPLDWRGLRVDTVRIKAHLSGPLSLLWSATYWYALPECTFIRYEASGGGGAPRTEIRLLEINRR